MAIQLILVIFALLSDNLLVKLTSKIFSNFSGLVKTIAQIIEILPNSNTLSSKQLQKQISNKSWELYHIAGFNMEKQNWKRYEIMQKKSDPYHNYKKGKIDKHELGKVRTDK